MWVCFLGWEDSPGGANGNPFQYSSWENPMDRGTWRASPKHHKESDMTEQQQAILNDRAFIHFPKSSRF